MPPSPRAQLMLDAKGDKSTLGPRGKNMLLDALENPKGAFVVWVRGTCCNPVECCCTLSPWKHETRGMIHLCNQQSLCVLLAAH